jgi:hypothetical protein
MVTKVSIYLNEFPATCHNIEKREVDEKGYDWDAGVPRYEHMHYDENHEIDFAPRIIGGTPAWAGEFPAKVSLQTRSGGHFCGGALIGEILIALLSTKSYLFLPI